MSAAAPVEDFLGRRIVSVRLQLEGEELADPALLELVETRPGEPLSMSDVRESIAHLFSLSRFEDVAVHATHAGDGVDLVYALVPLRVVSELRFAGDLGLAEGRLRGAVIERFGPSPPVGRAAEAARTLEALLKDYGFRDARVAPRTELRHGPDQTTLIFDVRAGPRTRVGTVAIEGTPVVPREELIDRLDLAPGRPYEPATLLARLGRVVDDLRRRGYYAASATHLPRVREDGTAEITVTVESGPLVEVAFEGDPLPPRRRPELVPIAREGSIDEDLIEDSVERIKAYLRSEGFRDADATVRRSESDGRLKLVFDVDRGPHYSVATVDVEGNTSVAAAELDALIRVKPGHPFVQAAVDADAARVAEHYRRRGFASVKVEPLATPAASSGVEVPVGVRLQIAEGPRTMVGRITFEGNTALTETELRQGLTAVSGRPFYPPEVATDRDAVLLKYLNRGYQQASVESTVEFSADRSAADIRYTVHEGLQVFIDHILIVGNRRTSARTIQRELAFSPGEPLAIERVVVESQRRLSALGLFRRVRITELQHPGAETRRDILVTVEEAPQTNVGFGGGLEGGARLRRSVEQGGRAVEVLELAPRGFFEIGRRALWGKNRSINLFTRVSFRPRNQVSSGDAVVDEGGGYGFNEYRVLATFREPKVFGTGADALITGVLEQGIRSSFNFSRRSVEAEVARRLPKAFSVAGRYSFGQTRLFDERYNQMEEATIDRFFPQVRLSTLSTALIRDTRNDPIDPAGGALMSIDGELSARRLGSEVGFARTLLQAFVFRPLAGSRTVVAGGARLGVATGFPREVTVVDENDRPIIGPSGVPRTEIVDDVPASERFFAGGGTTVRGFALDQLGRADTIDRDGFPKGGHALMILNAEVRVAVWRELGAVAFFDAGNVFARVPDLNVTELRTALGIGLRYRSPLGPLRVDVGFNLDPREIVPGRFESRRELHISLGQAF